MVVLARRAAAAAGWLALSAFLFAASGKPLSFSPHELPDEAARALWEQTRETANLGRPLEALACVQRLLRAFPNNTRYLQEEASLFETLGDWPRAARAWELYVSAAAAPIEGCPRLGRAWSKTGDEARALDAHRRCAGFDATSSDMALYYALALERARKTSDARRQFARVLELSPHYADASVGLARLALLDGDAAAALKLLDALEAKDAGSPDALVARAQALIRLGRRAQARAELEKARAAAPDYKDVQDLLKELEP